MSRGLRLKHLNRVGEYKSGNPRWYYRPEGAKGIAMPDLTMNDPIFLLAYAQASGVKRSAPVQKGSLGSAVEKYLGSAQFKLYEKKTRDQRRRSLDRIRETTGGAKTLTPDIIRADLAKYDGHAQHTQLKMWRGFCKYLMSIGALKSNPSKEMERAPVAKSDGHEPWTDYDVKTYRKHWAIHKPERLAFELIFYTGASMVDAVKLGPGKVGHGGWLSYKRTKTGGMVEIPFNRKLPHFARTFIDDLAYLIEAINAAPQTHMTWIVTAYGASRSEKSASSWFSKKAQKAGVPPGKTAHGLRKLRDMLIAENEGTPNQCMSWLGHETLAEATRYTKKYDRRRALTDKTGEQKSI